jgi:hypothetical protein
MFFEPVPADEDPAPRRLPHLPPWEGPPALEAGVLLAAGQTVARSAKVVVFLSAIRAFSSGCMLETEIVSRRSAWPEDDMWDLQSAMHRSFRGFRGARLPDELLRLGVRYADDRKATTLENRRRDRHDGAPDGPRLSWWPGGSGSRANGDLGFSHLGLWLWPLPPEGSFEFAAEWPAAGIELTIVELDSAAIVAAAAHPQYYWPDDQA